MQLEARVRKGAAAPSRKELAATMRKTGLGRVPPVPEQRRSAETARSLGQRRSGADPPPSSFTDGNSFNVNVNGFYGSTGQSPIGAPWIFFPQCSDPATWFPNLSFWRFGAGIESETKYTISRFTCSIG
ncbi:uncharacterized protein LOC120687289 [Panicum virgatum]|uniref:uncharacterized protein LOC120687289 n=1 Tax=Panicum virgatum TaxID=38727 RepID=UPI0019D67B6A|nr:uncharacterized protein LOC120687289 [Panicum virgatum]